MVTVKQLIKLLKTYPQDLPVAYRCYSEQVLLNADDLDLLEAGEPREDGWVHDKRPDKPTRQYLLFPGN